MGSLGDHQVDQLRVRIFESVQAAGEAAARRVAEQIRLEYHNDPAKRVACLFAAAVSQDCLLGSLARDSSIDWSKITAFHMDEYLGIVPDHPASFRRYLHERLFGRVDLSADHIHVIPAEQDVSPLQVCLDYENLIRRHQPQIVCAGIGENGHLAFNDPPVADFEDPVWVKVVRLDQGCRQQQVHDGAFTGLEEVPKHAYTLTIPALMAARSLDVVVTGIRKAPAVREVIFGPISTSCPASILRTHLGAVLYLDPESASLLSIDSENHPRSSDTNLGG